LPIFEEKPWTVRGQDSNVGQDALNARASGYWLLAGTSIFTPYSKKCPGAAVEPVGEPAFKLLGLNGP
jgi:hypothetical protein